MGKGVLLGAAGSFPADLYLEAFPSLTTLTGILRFAQYSDQWEAGRFVRNADFIIIAA